MTGDNSIAPGIDYPPEARLNEISRPLPKVAPGTVDPAAMSAEVALMQAKEVFEAFNLALARKDQDALADCFYPDPGQAHWRDIVALTSHLRTFTEARNVAAALLETTSRCGLSGSIECTGKAQFAVVNPVMVSYPWTLGVLRDTKK